jgi:calcineurin-like phosphoesterase family protein
MTIFFTADHHFGHTAIIEYVERPFKTVDDMNEGLTERWNAVVRRGDTVYHLGDFSLCGPTKAIEFMQGLNGFIRLVPGGHDKRWLTKRVRVEREGLMVVEGPLISKHFGSRIITLCHYPLLSWEQSHYGAMHFHGHTHGTIGRTSKSADRLFPPGAGPGARVDVGVDCWDFQPVALDTLLDQYG